MNKQEYKFYIEADRIIAGIPGKSILWIIRQILFPDSIRTFMSLLRKVEFLMDNPSTLNKMLLPFIKYRFYKISLKLGFSIPPKVFGPGLLIPHYGTITINSNARVGSYCVLHTSTCIAGSESKIFGDGLYMSTGSIIAGFVSIGNNVTISANSFLNKSISEENVMVGGTPAKVIKTREAWYNCDGEQYQKRVEQIERLRKKMFQ